ncbi:ArsR/SmtB family transcription factor [Thermoplasma volcanium]|nr:winged helix-turn-helix domain-containing protein [Thermoplasma volcanium]
MPLVDSDYSGEYKRLIWWLFYATRGGDMRRKIIDLIRNNPSNQHQISRVLGVNYRTVEHHLHILEQNNIVYGMGDKYGRTFFISQSFLDKLPIYDEFKNKVEKNS